MEIEVGDGKVEVRKKERIVVERLVGGSGKVVSRERMLEKVWDECFVDEKRVRVK
ncbi:winged helix-turn-helix domain-containing protein, partial [Paenibacillus xylanexedens]|uniref:winged helix-turn-helix domain-containing protein n=1 Tax=Paenibacillus xylanexedens TaxID=528191 RepID=UPI0034D9858B